MTGIKNYLRNLWLALTSNNPYQVELDEVREEYEKTKANVKRLEDFYCKALENWDKAGSQTKDLQVLVENLRKRVAEKDALIAEMDKDCRRQADGYKKRIAEYGEQIARLQGQLAKARKRNKAAATAKAKAKGKTKEEKTQK